MTKLTGSFAANRRGSPRYKSPRIGSCVAPRLMTKSRCEFGQLFLSQPLR